MSAGIIRITFKEGIPNFLEKENLLSDEKIKRVKYIHEENMIDFKPGQITFKLKRKTINSK